MNKLNDLAEQLEAEGVFLGGPKKLFGVAGQKLLILLLSEGLTPFSKLLDVGCGCLRGGHWLIRILNRGSYFGIEPNIDMLQAGLRVLLEQNEIELKKPKFSHNDDFDFSVFEEEFDFIIARSIWTHCSRNQIKAMLDSFLRVTKENGAFFTSYKNTDNLRKSYLGNEWVGKSHLSDEPGIVHHSFDWIKTECMKRKLSAEEVNDEAYNFSNQTWIKITHSKIG